MNSPFAYFRFSVVAWILALAIVFLMDFPSTQAAPEAGTDTQLVQDTVQGTEVTTYKGYEQDIKPIFESRCINCHSCYNAPCQLKLTSEEGIERGLVQDYQVHDSHRIHHIAPTRLGIDRLTTAGWRELNFVSVLGNELEKNSSEPGDAELEEPTAAEKQDRTDNSFIYTLVKYKGDHKDVGIDDFGDYKNQQAEYSRVCPTNPEELKEHIQDRADISSNPGMPYGLPALENSEIELIKQWTEKGSPLTTTVKAMSSSEQETKKQIENFLNAYKPLKKDTKERFKKSLVSRYLYEHLFLAHIYLNPVKPGAEPGKFFSLIRSTNSCDNEKLDVVSTVRPWDKPSGDGSFYYCLQPIESTIVRKTHTLYLVDGVKLQRWSDLFLSDKYPWEMTASTHWLAKKWDRYKIYFEHLYRANMAANEVRKNNKIMDGASRYDAQASNPFLVFKDIPVKARYQFLLDDAEYHVMTFIRGPVCKGNTAVNSIDEQFYVFFIDPESDLMVKDPTFAEESVNFLELPAEKGSEQIGIIRTIKFAKRVRKDRNQYRENRAAAYKTHFKNGYGIKDLWNGNNEVDQNRFGVEGQAPANTNAALTVFRNYDSSSVLQGTVGPTSKTIFVVDYSILERLVYSLVSGFDVFGDINHQLHTRIYMSYLKMEAEEAFLSFIPRDVRTPMRDSWYRKADYKLERLDPDKLQSRFPLLGLDMKTELKYDGMSFDEEAFGSLSKIQQDESLRSYRQAFVQSMREHLGVARGYEDKMNSDHPLGAAQKPFPNPEKVTSTEELEANLNVLSDVRAIKAPWVRFIPSLSYLVVETESEEPTIYTIIRNKEHLNIAWIGGEKDRRDFEMDSVLFYKGVAGSHANHIFVLPMDRMQPFLNAMVGIKDGASYEKWIEDYGTPRFGKGSERFWSNSDFLHEVYRKKSPLNYGVIDYNRYGVEYRFNSDDESEAAPDSLISRLPAVIKNAVKGLMNGTADKKINTGRRSGLPKTDKGLANMLNSEKEN